MMLTRDLRQSSRGQRTRFRGGTQLSCWIYWSDESFSSVLKCYYYFNKEFWWYCLTTHPHYYGWKLWLTSLLIGQSYINRHPTCLKIETNQKGATAISFIVLARNTQTNPGDEGCCHFYHVSPTVGGAVWLCYRSVQSCHSTDHTPQWLHQTA